MEDAKIIFNLFEDLANLDEEIKEMRADIKERVEAFCENNDEFEPKAIKEAYRFFKKLTKDKSSTVDEEFQRDKLVELLIGKS